ncbi:MFS transporter [Streptomyces sp. NBC_01433]|uniref:MFS transporter n=1 Tax=Streptomyces sp. NBC_01433 TaxID=2903864 RepID=UPI00225BE6F4|nr:MFS transporter [Streptomyces sp. NBC_01433]MCX4678721.1 MFS transporter [Streptomyces sp. NBC_01433]
MGAERAAVGGRFTGPQVFLLAGSFLITLGSFAVLPYMSVLLHQRLGLGLGTVGFVLAVASLLQFSGGVVAGPVAGRIGLRRAMWVALALRTAGFAAFVPGLTSPVLAVGALFLVSAGAALYLPANKAYLVDGAAEAERPRLLSASGSAFNAGMALGPPLAAPFVLGSPMVVFSCVAGLFALVGVGHALLPPGNGTTAGPTGGGKGRPGGRSADCHEDRPQKRRAGPSPFAVTVLSVYVFMFFQHYVALYAIPRTSAAFYGGVLMGYAGLLVVAQPLLAHRIAALSYRSAMRVGFGAMAAGAASIGFGGYLGIGAGSALMCLGEIVLFLKNDLEALARSPAPAASVFGRQRLAAGIGAFGSGVVGGQLYGAAEAADAVPGFWVAVCVQALLPPLFLLGRRTGPDAGAGRASGTARPSGTASPSDTDRPTGTAHAPATERPPGGPGGPSRSRR